MNGTSVSEQWGAGTRVLGGGLHSAKAGHLAGSGANTGSSQWGPKGRPSQAWGVLGGSSGAGEKVEGLLV